MKKSIKAFHYAALLILFNMLTSFSNNTFSQDKQPYVRIAKIEVDNLQLENYKAAEDLVQWLIKQTKYKNTSTDTNNHGRL